MGALFGVAMIPLMYAFGKRMFKRPELALLAAGLFAFDFMHFSQTRISTIDVYGVFFNMCMTYYMYKFIKMDLGDSLKDTLIPLGLSGLFFGLGCASKWICIYTGAALAVMFFVKMITLWVKANKIKNAKLTKAEEADPAVANARKFPARFIKPACSVSCSSSSFLLRFIRQHTDRITQRNGSLMRSKQRLHAFVPPDSSGTMRSPRAKF